MNSDNTDTELSQSLNDSIVSSYDERENSEPSAVNETHLNESDDLGDSNDNDSGNSNVKYTIYSPPKNINSMVDKFYSLKAKYESEKLKMRNKLMGENMPLKTKKKMYNASYPKCVNCKRSVGMLFNVSNTQLSVQCGAVQGIFKKKDGTTIQPCDVSFIVDLPQYNNITHLMDDYQDLLQKLKNDLKLLKLQHLYGHIDDDQSLEKYQKIMEDYTSNSEAYSSLKQLHVGKQAGNEDEIQMLKTELAQYYSSINDALTEARTQGVENQGAYKTTAFGFYNDYHKVAALLREKRDYKTFFDTNDFINTHTHLNRNSIYEDEIYIS